MQLCGYCCMALIQNERVSLLNTLNIVYIWIFIKDIEDIDIPSRNVLVHNI